MASLEPSPLRAFALGLALALAPPVAAQAATGTAPPEIVSARAVLLDFLVHKVQPDASFSFERGYGGRDRSGKPKVRNDWDVMLQGSMLRVDTVADDCSLLVDLGAVPLAELAQRPPAPFEEMVQKAAALRYEPSNRDAKRPSPPLPAKLGHCYFVWTNDGDSDVATLFEVVEQAAGDHCTLEWYSTEDGSYARGSLRAAAGERPLLAVLLALRAIAVRLEGEKLADDELREPRIVVQVRGGNVGTCRVDVARAHSDNVKQLAVTPIAVAGPIAADEPIAAYCRGGRIPAGRRLVITNVTWLAEAHGDANGAGRVRVQLGDETLIDFAASDHPVRGGWSGRVELRAGQEARAFVEIGNSSACEVVFAGRLEKLPE